MRCAVLIVYLANETIKTEAFIDYLIENNRLTSFGVFRFCNGEEVSEKKLIKKKVEISTYSSGRNVGIAVARNFLVEKAKNWGAGYFIFLDNDLILPIDYIKSLLDGYLNAKKIYSKVGAVAPLVINQYKIDDQKIPYSVIENWGTISIETKRLDIYYYIGVTYWKEIYIYSPNFNRLRKILRAGSQVKKANESEQIWPPDKEYYRKKIGERNVKMLETKTVPGGVAIFDSDLWAVNGGFAPEFSPFGNEDSEFYLRAHFSGFRNLVLSDIAVIHKSERGAARNYLFKRMIEGRMRRILIDRYINSIMEKIFCYIDSIVGFSITFMSFKEFSIINRVKIVFWYVYGYLLKPTMEEKEFVELSKRKMLYWNFVQ